MYGVKKQTYSLTEGPLFWNIIRYTIPIILTSVLQLLFNAADLVIVGRFCGSVSVAAVGATGSITHLLVNFFVGLSAGAGVTVAHALGGREHEAVHRTVHTAMSAALVSGVILTVVGVCFSEVFLRWMSTPENVLPLSAVYMKIYFAGITFTMVYNFAAAILRAAGDTKSPLLYLTIAGVVNVVLNVFFVIVFHMNVAGVALATTISQGVSAALVVWALMRRSDACHFAIKKMRFYRLQMAKILRIGLPAGIQSSLFAISNVLIQSSINSFGDVFVAGNAASANIEGFVYVTMNAFHQTAVNFTGQNVGAGQYRRVRKIFGYSLAGVAVAGMIVGSAAWFFGEQLLGIYITDSPEAIAYGVVRLTYISLPYFVCGLMDVCTGSLRGMGASLTPMLISVMGVCGLRILWINTVFRAFPTPGCLYISYLISWTVTFLVQCFAFWMVYRKHIKSILPH